MLTFALNLQCATSRRAPRINTVAPHRDRLLIWQ
jgi:hypothetical protein